MDVLRRYARAVIHMRDRRRAGRLALGLGAGVSLDLGFPSWERLVASLEGHPEFEGCGTNSNASLTVRAQALFLALEAKIGRRFAPSAEAERSVRMRWLRLVHEVLYADVPESPAELLTKHPYLGSFLETIKQSPLTINYNFDDSIERMLNENYRTEQNDRNERVYETVWEPSTQFRRSAGVIYHPNGFLPRNLVEGFSDDIVFSEAEYADQLFDVAHGHYATLASHLTRFTCLFLGLSLNDSTLKHLLRQNVRMNPGHPQYYVRHCRDTASIPAERLDTETLANYDIYGTITLHLTTPGIQSLGRLLTCADADLHMALDGIGAPRKYVYYLSGAVGTGKTSVVQRMKSISTVAEWTEPRPTELQKPHSELSEPERTSVDSWVSQQFRRKNFFIISSRDGLVACDRTPLDPLVFVREGDLSRRAAQHLGILRPNHPAGEPLAPGHVILLEAGADELLARASDRLDGASADYLEDQRRRLRALFGDNENTVTVLSTSARGIANVIRAVCKIIHLAEYNPFDLDAELVKLAQANP